ncbi:HAD family hydrolase [Pseudonocardia halophobica]|uniref:HAD family hydrolase n=1 Tax=Pseudonocardia halophobica TaxID=29401 RepID=UPI003D938098
MAMGHGGRAGGPRAGTAAPRRPRRPRAVLVDVYDTVLRTDALRRRFVDVGRPEHEYELFLAHALRDAMGFALAGTPTAFGRVLTDALRSATGHKLSDDALAHIRAGFTALPAFADAEPALTVLARSRIPAWAVAQGSGDHTSGALDATGLRTYLRGTVASDDLGVLPPDPEAYRLACAAARVDPETTAFVSAHGYLVHGAMRAGLVGALVLREGEGAPATIDLPHVTGTSLVTTVEALLDLPS